MKKKLLISVLFFLIAHCTLIIENCMCQWVQVSSGIGNKEIVCFTTCGGNLYTGTSYGIYLTSNNGTNWILKSLSGRNIHSLASNETVIYAGIDTALCRSTDYGSNWTYKKFELSSGVISIVVYQNYVIAAEQNFDFAFIYKSSDNGINWSNVRSVLGNHTQVANFQNYFYISTDSPPCFFYSSPDYGLNWSSAMLYSYGLPSCIGVNNNYVYSGTGSYSGNDTLYGLCLSSDYGNSWSITSLTKRTITAITTSGNNIIAGSRDSGIYVSTNNGLSWTRKNEGLPALPTVNSLFIYNNYIYAGITNNSAWRRPLSELITGINATKPETPNSFSLFQNYPNPFNPNTTISYKVASYKVIKLVVYDILGKEVVTLVNENLRPGTYEVPFSINRFSDNQLSSGIYFYTLFADGVRIETKRMVLIK